MTCARCKRCPGLRMAGFRKFQQTYCITHKVFIAVEVCTHLPCLFIQDLLMMTCTTQGSPSAAPLFTFLFEEWIYTDCVLFIKALKSARAQSIFSNCWPAGFLIGLFRDKPLCQRYGGWWGGLIRMESTHIFQSRKLWRFVIWISYVGCLQRCLAENWNGITGECAPNQYGVRNSRFWFKFSRPIFRPS
jgi:hypothetical protein